MKRAAIIPKAAVGAVCLIIALVLSLPVLPIVSNRLFGGGTIDFNTEEYGKYRNNAPIEGDVTVIFGASGDSSGDGYYYLVPLKGKAIDNKNKIDTLILIRAKNGSDGYTKLNDVFRASKEGSASTYSFAGVLRSCSKSENETAQDLRSETSYTNLQLSEYYVDLSTSPSAVMGRFWISFLFTAVTIFCVVLVIQGINKNAGIDDIEESRIAYKIEQDKKSGNTNDDGSDKMFGNSDASYGVKPNSSGATGGFNPSFQSQGNSEPMFMSDEEIGSNAMNAATGGSAGFLDDSDYQPERRPSYMDEPPAQGQGGYDDDDSFFGGGFFGGQ